jgi:soluble lytic murein transglycosylase-like protein
MSIFDLDQAGQRNLADTAVNNPLSPDSLEASTFKGMGKGIALGVARGGAKAGRAVAIAGQAIPKTIDSVSGDDTAADWYQENVVEPTDYAVDYYTPQAGTVGKAGQILGGLGEIVLPLMASAGNPALLVGSEALNMERDLVKSGVDSGTASEAGLAQGVATAIGFKIPFFGNTLTSRVTSGAAGNLAVNAGTAGVQSQILISEGYEQQAQQFDPLNFEARAIDVLTGIAFGGLAHAMSPKGDAIAAQALKPSDADALLTTFNAQHFQEGTAPGVPVDMASSVAHQSAMELATNQLIRGEPVQLPKSITDANFLAPAPAARNVLADAIRDSYRDIIPAADRWAPSQDLTGIPLEQRRALRYDAPELNGYAAAIEQQMGLPAGLLNAIKNAGERSNSDQVSPAGARGVMQFMPENLRKFGVTDATDPVQIIEAAGRYFTKTSRQYGGNIDAMIADYNGGPRQAREVLAGRQPKAKETRDYLKRVRAELGRDVPSRDMPLARTPDEFPLIPAEQAGYAKALEDEIQSVEVTRADLMTVVSGMADLGEVTRVRAEISPLTERRQQLDDVNATRDIAKEIQAAKPRTSYKQALAQAETQRVAEVTDLDARIGRLEGFLQKNTEANQAAQQLAQLDEQIILLRDNRAAIEVPAAMVSPIADAVRSAIESMPARRDLPATASPESQVNTQRMSAQISAEPALNAAEAPINRSSVAAANEPTSAAAPKDRSAQAVDYDIELAQQAINQVDDIRLPTGAVDADGNPVTVSARELLAEADADIQRAQQESTGFLAAVSCFLQRGT